MTAFLVATSHIKDPHKFLEYSAKAGPTLAPFGGELVLRGKANDVLAGHCDHQALISLRNEAVDII